MTTQQIAWWPQPLAGDVLWCHFPHLPAMEPGPKPRPGLVLQVRDIGSNRYVAYGTSQKTRQLRTGEFRVSPEDGAAYHLMGLAAETKFNLRQNAELDYNAHWFERPPHKPFGESPKLGTLHASLMPRVSAAC